MRRSCVVPPRESGGGADASQGSSQGSEGSGAGLNAQLVSTLLHQAHLSPLAPSQSPAYWRLDTSLWLHPTPDVLVLADRQSQYAVPYPEADCLSFNPGAFAADFSWMVYRPGTREVEPSSLA